MRNGAIFISEDVDVVTMEIERIATLVQQGIMSPTEAQGILERMLSPQIINLAGTQEQIQEISDELNRTPARSMIVSDKVDLAPIRLIEDALRDRMARLYARGVPIQEMVDQMAMEGYRADTLLYGRTKLTIGSDPAVEIAEPMVTFRAEATEDLKSGDLVVVDGDGNARRAREGEQIVGVHLGDGHIRFTGGRMDMSWANRGSVAFMGSMAYHASIAYGGPQQYWDRRTQVREPPGQRVDAPAFKYTERFPKEVEAKAMELLRKFMNPEQYEAFMDRASIELENKAGTHRLIINQNGSFRLLKGGQGAGIEMTAGNVRSYRFPLGDEIAAFLDWFRYKTPELIQNWNCGNFGIVRDGLDERR